MVSLATFLFVLGIVGANSHGWGQYYPHGQGYPQGQNYPRGHAYGHGQDYPQGQNYPEGENYPEGHHHHPQGQYYPQEDVNVQQPPPYNERQPFDPNAEKPKVKLVPGSMDDLRNMDTQWICTNQKTGDTMLIGSMDGIGNTLGPKPLPPQPPKANPQRPQQPSPWPQEPQQSSPWPREPQLGHLKPLPSPWPQPPQQPQRPQPPQQPQQPQPRPLPVPQNPPQSGTTSGQLTPTESTRNPGFVEVPPGFTESKQDPPKSPSATTKDPLEAFDWAAYIKTANCSAPTLAPPSVTTPVPEFDGTGVIEPRVNN